MTSPALKPTAPALVVDASAVLRFRQEEQSCVPHPVPGCLSSFTCCAQGKAERAVGRQQKWVPGLREERVQSLRLPGSSSTGPGLGAEQRGLGRLGAGGGHDLALAYSL